MDRRRENPITQGRVSTEGVGMHSNRSTSIVDTVAVAVCGFALSWREDTHRRQQPAPFLANSWLQISLRRFEYVALVTVLPLGM